MEKWKLSKVNDKWVMSTITGDRIAIREMNYWERILYWIKIYMVEYPNYPKKD